VLVTTVLDPEHCSNRLLALRARAASRTERLAQRHEIGAGDDTLDRRELPQPTGAVRKRRSAPHHDGTEPRIAARAPAHRLPDIAFRFRRHRAGIEDREVGVGSVVDQYVPCVDRHRAHQFAVVVIRATAESAQMNLHLA